MEFLAFKTDDYISRRKIQINTIEELLELLKNMNNFKGKYDISYKKWCENEIVIGYDDYDKMYFIEFVNDYRE